MTSARSWHMYNNFPTTVLCVARLSFSSSTSDSVLTLGVVTGFCFFQTKNSYHVSDVLLIRLHGVASCRSPRDPGRKCCHPASPFVPRFSSKLALTRVQPVSELHFSVQTLTRHRHERKYLCSSHRFGNNLDPSGVGDSSDFPGHSRDACATILVLCDIRTVLCLISTLRLLSVLHHTIHLVMVVLQTNLGRHPRAGMLCIRQSKL